MSVSIKKGTATEVTVPKNANPDCCDTNLTNPQEKAKIENAFLPKIKTLSLWILYEFVSQIYYSIKTIILQEVFINLCIFRKMG